MPRDASLLKSGCNFRQLVRGHFSSRCLLATENIHKSFNPINISAVKFFAFTPSVIYESESVIVIVKIN